MNLFYAPHIAAGPFTLSHEESQHVTRVLRKQAGELIRLTDGRGYFYEGRILNPDPSACVLEVIRKVEGTDRRLYRIHLAVAPTKNINRFEWFLEKATELGVDRITPMICRHSERKIIKTKRLEKVLIAAMKQSLKSVLPQLDEMMTFREVIGMAAGSGKYIAYADPDVRDELAKAYRPAQDAIILIGPEGDFDPEEVTQARAMGFKTVRLGPSRLRTETAALVACHTIHTVNLLTPG